MEDVNLLLSFIETEIMNGKKPLFGNGVTVDGEAVLSLVKRVRQAVNAMNGENLVAEANERAKLIIAAAEQRRAQILEENEIVAEAKEIAESMVDDAEKRRKQSEEFTRNNLINMLTSVRGTIKDADESLTASLEKLRNAKN